MLVSSETELSLVYLGDLQKTSLHGEVGGVLDTSILNEHGEVMLAVLIFLPAKGVDVAVELERLLFFKLLTPVFLNSGSEDINTHVVNGVL